MYLFFVLLRGKIMVNKRNYAFRAWFCLGLRTFYYLKEGKSMKCPNCGAETGDKVFCEFCGTKVVEETPSEPERPIKNVCPQCGSSNIQFKRETQGEVRGKNSKRVIHKTVGFCKDCGATWYPEQPTGTKAKKPIYKRWWFWLLALALIIGIGTGGSGKSSGEEEAANQETAVAETNVEETANEEVAVEETAAEEATAEETTINPQASWSREQQNAYKAGLSYLEFMSFSRQGLIDQLSSEYGDQYPLEVAEFAVNAIEEDGLVDWDAECEEAAESYLSFMTFSKQELIDQLCSDYGDQFTREQAERAVEKVY